MNQTSDRQKVLIAAVAVAFLLCYAGVLIHIVSTWSSNYLYSYGFAVPLISGYMLKADPRAAGGGVGTRLRAGLPDLAQASPCCWRGIRHRQISR